MPPQSFRSTSFRSRLRSRTRGFSLVEITLALGIVSLAVFSMIGGLSVGMETIHDASDNTMHAQIVSQLTASAFQTPRGAASGDPFAALDGLVSNGPIKFDQAGREVTNQSDAIYEAKIEWDSSAGYPGEPAQTGAYPSSRTMIITVMTKPGGAAEPISQSKASVIIPRS